MSGFLKKLRGWESNPLPQDYEPCVQPLHFPAFDIVAFLHQSVNQNCLYNHLMWFVYVLLCEDQSFYTGISKNLERRYSEHKSGRGGKYTRSHKPIKLIYKEELLTRSDALKREAKIKSWGRDKKIKTLNLRK